jgi:hypothetical protein
MSLVGVRQAAPWRRKMSATSSFGRDIASASFRRCRCHVQEFERALNLPDHVAGHAAAPPSSVMNSLRPLWDIGLPPSTDYCMLSLPQKKLIVPWGRPELF